jgi:hypothetical protein
MFCVRERQRIVEVPQRLSSEAEEVSLGNVDKQAKPHH